MEKGINLQIEEFRENLITTINQSNMPISVVELVLKDLFTNASLGKQQQVEKEKKDFTPTAEETETK